MVYRTKIIIRGSLLLMLLFVSSCVHNIPLVVDSDRDIKQAMPNTKKLPAKVGFYLNDDLMKYVFKQQKMGMTFQMKAGDYLRPIGTQMAATIFDDVLDVDSLPPYKGNNKPPVEGVIEPEVLYVYGNANGTLRGYLEAKLKIRITAYDLGGKIVWQGEAMGEDASEEMDFVKTFLGGMKDVGKTGYRAAFDAVVKILEDFNETPPEQLFSLLEIKDISSLQNKRNISDFDLFKKYFEKGLYQYENSNFYQALYAFENAATLNPDDGETLFYIGACYAYTADREKAIKNFQQVIKLNPSSKEALDSKKWLDILGEPLKVGIVWLNRDEGNAIKDDAQIRQALTDSQMYEVIDSDDWNPSLKDSFGSKEFNNFLEKCRKRGIHTVIFTKLNFLNEKVKIDDPKSGDVAREYIAKIKAEAYSTGQKGEHAAFEINERMSTLLQKNRDEENIIEKQLVRKGAEKLVLELLEKDIF